MFFAWVEVVDLMMASGMLYVGWISADLAIRVTLALVYVYVSSPCFLSRSSLCADFTGGALLVYSSHKSCPLWATHFTNTASMDPILSCRPFLIAQGSSDMSILKFNSLELFENISLFIRVYPCV